jgi:adenylate cyclase class 2
MSHTLSTVEIKARCPDPAAIRRSLGEDGARFIGEDHQVDTYFRVPRGRLKLREGTIERYLIYYERPDSALPKPSVVSLYRPAPDPSLKALLTRALGVHVVVEKYREIYFIENVKVHLDRLEGLGAFVEVEAIDAEGALGHDHLEAQCRHYMARFRIATADLLEASYSDLQAAL